MDCRLISLVHLAWGHRRIWFGVGSFRVGAFFSEHSAAWGRVVLSVLEQHLIGSFGGALG